MSPADTPAGRDLIIELDEATLHTLRSLGDPAELLAELARAVAAATRSGAHLDAASDEAPPLSIRLPEDVALIADQREANEQMIRSTLLAHDAARHAEQARLRAEAREHELQEVAELREMFIGILGHDLRNPLTSVVMAALALLRRGHLDGTDARTAQRIVRGARRIDRMVAQLLDLTRARLGGGISLVRVATDLREVCRHVVEELEGPVHVDAVGDMVGDWDPDRLAAVVSNLVANALQYATPGTTVTVEARVDGADVVVEVGNVGDAIPPAVLPFIFEPFRRARRQEASANGNLGLGLYIAHEIVAAHGGSLGAASNERATTFTVRLPRGTPSGPPRSVADGSARPRAVEPTTGPPDVVPTSRRILVVEDELEMAELFTYLLEKDGHRTIAAHDGSSALEAVRAHDPEVVILDLGLPDMDGYEVARRLRQEPGGASRLLIAVTGYQADRPRLDEAGFDTKPPDMEELARMMDGSDGA
jgi:two-component system CheB/CheR fusion protein